jgi:hypothetical protein
LARNTSQEITGTLSHGRMRAPQLAHALGGETMDRLAGMR